MVVSRVETWRRINLAMQASVMVSIGFVQKSLECLKLSVKKHLMNLMSQFGIALLINLSYQDPVG